MCLYIYQIGQPDSWFLNAWISSYSTYKPREWGTNSVIMAYTISTRYPDQIHVEPGTFVFPNFVHNLEMYARHYKFSDNYCIHIYGESEFYVPQSEAQLAGYDCTLGDVMRYVLYGSSRLRSNNTRNGILLKKRPTIGRINIIIVAMFLCCTVVIISGVVFYWLKYISVSMLKISSVL